MAICGGTNRIKSNIIEEAEETAIKLIRDFEEMGFVPTTLTPDPEKTAKEWKEHLVAVIKEYDNQIEQLKSRLVEYKKPIDKFIKDCEAQAVKVFANVIMGRFQEVCPMDASQKITLFDAIGIVLDALKEYKE